MFLLMSAIHTRSRMRWSTFTQTYERFVYWAHIHSDSHGDTYGYSNTNGDAATYGNSNTDTDAKTYGCSNAMACKRSRTTPWAALISLWALMPAQILQLDQQYRHRNNGVTGESSTIRIGSQFQTKTFIAGIRVVRADEKLTTFLKLEAAIRVCIELGLTRRPDFF
jgi:hypothetical protein